MKKEFKFHQVPLIESVQDMILKNAEKYPDNLALHDLQNTPINRLTYSELLANILRFGAALKKTGLKERAHVAVIGENRVQWALSYLTLMCFNYVVVPIDKNLHVNEILNILHESDSEAVIFSEHFASVLEEKKASLKNLKYYISMDEINDGKKIRCMKKLIDETPPIALKNLPKIKTGEMAELIFTSGSLGRAKGVMLSQKNIASNLMDMVSALFIYPEDRFLSVLPMHHTYECTCGMLCPLYCGASVHFARSLRTILDDIQRVQATVMLGVPLLYDKIFKNIYKGIQENKITATVITPLIKISDLLSKLGWKNSKNKIFAELHKKFGGHVRIFIAGGAAADPMVAKGMREFGFNFLQGYGMTEGSPILALNQIDNFKDNAAGIPLPNVEMKILNPDDDNIGEIAVKAANIMIGYYKNEKATKESFENGWFKTGDLGFIDEDGFLHISGRKKNVIISKSGKNVFPEEIEDVLNRSPFILESYVYGEDDSKQDEIIAVQIVVDAEAFIELSESKNIKITDELINEVISEEIKKTNKLLSSYKHIKKFYIREREFEKTTTQKIKRYLIQK